MLNPDILVDAITAKIKLIPGFMTFMNSVAGNVSSYTDNDVGRTNAVEVMTAPSTLVCWEELEDVAEGQAEWLHRIVIYIRLAPNPTTPNRFGAVLYQLTNGVPTGDTRRLLGDTDVPDPRWEMIGIPTALRVIDELGVEYLVVTVRYRQKVED